MNPQKSQKFLFNKISRLSRLCGDKASLYHVIPPVPATLIVDFVPFDTFQTIDPGEPISHIDWC